MSTPSSSPTTLDGRIFRGIVLEAGQTAGDAETLAFANGRFHSSACDAYGYGDGPYTMSRVGDSLQFDAETESPQYGKLRWHGSITGRRLDGTLTMLRNGAAVHEKWVLAGEAKA